MADSPRPPLLQSPRPETFIAAGGLSRPSSVFIPFFFQKGEWTLLLEKRTGTISHPGQFAFPGGHYDEGDSSLMATALRETSEEIGVPLSDLEPGGAVGVVVNPWGKVVHGFWGVLKSETMEDLRPSPREVESLHLLPLREIQSSSSFRKGILEWEAVPQTGPELTFKARQEAGKPLRHEIVSLSASFGVIWGITGRFLLMVHQLLLPQGEPVKFP